jgi:hypothetical protein
MRRRQARQIPLLIASVTTETETLIEGTDLLSLATAPLSRRQSRQRESLIEEEPMNCEGIWKVEITTPYGWERIATAFMKNGEYLAASANHYSVGSYTQNGDDVEISTVVTQYGDFRTVFEQNPIANLRVISVCKIDGDEIAGKSKPEGRENCDILVRLTRLAGLDQ